jgi:hypothetical protein
MTALEAVRVMARLAGAGRLEQTIAGMRRSGYTDRDTAQALGVSRQAIQQRWPRRDEDSGGTS